MEGLRGVAVSMVFLQHYSKQVLTHSAITGGAKQFAIAFCAFGNRGVELFFLLSGFLIYGYLLRRRPDFLNFMLRRAQRLYPAFIVAMAIGAIVDPWRPKPKIPSGVAEGATYLLANLLFLPGLLPIPALFAVNWSLSYEWWFYAASTFLVAICGIGLLARPWRVLCVVGLGAALVVPSALGVPSVPIRGLCLICGMLLAEARAGGWRPIPSPAVVVIATAGFAVSTAFELPDWAATLLVAITLYALCSAVLQKGAILPRLLSARYLRWFGNMSYSFYLVHGFVVVLATEAMVRLAGNAHCNLMFWMGLVPTFSAAALAGAALFLAIEKPYSFRASGAIAGPVSIPRMACVPAEPVSRSWSDPASGSRASSNTAQASFTNRAAVRVRPARSASMASVISRSDSVIGEIGAAIEPSAEI